MTAKRPSFGRVTATALLLLSTSLSGQAMAETLQGALAKAYASNPTLTGARAGQRATDENVPLQKASGRPTAQSQLQFQELVVSFY